VQPSPDEARKLSALEKYEGRGFYYAAKAASRKAPGGYFLLYPETEPQDVKQFQYGLKRRIPGRSQ
jgi:hypothetical protein